MDTDRSFSQIAKKSFYKSMKRLIKSLIYYQQHGTFNSITKNLRRCIEHSNRHYNNKFLQLFRICPVHKELLTDTLFIAIEAKNHYVAEQFILDGANLHFLRNGKSPLEVAVQLNDLEMVCMLLYYDGYRSVFSNGLSPFNYSLLTGKDVNIQRALILYEEDFDGSLHVPSITRIATSSVLNKLAWRRNYFEIFYYDWTECTVVEMALICEVEPDIFEIIWNKFNYKLWIEHVCGSFISTLFIQYTHLKYLADYLSVYLNNEDKLKLDIEIHTDLQVGQLFLLRTFSAEAKMTYTLQLLSYGAVISDIDLTTIYIDLVKSGCKKQTITNFCNTMFHMNLVHTFSLYNLMYFYYTPVPDLMIFLNLIDVNTIESMNALRKLKGFFAFDTNIVCRIQKQCPDYRQNIIADAMCNGVQFPSLVQLGRDALRKVICDKYSIRNSSQLHTIVKHLDIGNHIKNILMFKSRIYLNDFDDENSDDEESVSYRDNRGG